MKDENAFNIDKQVGTNVRDIRQRRGMSQTELSKATKVSFQQVQKYERGTNRMAASTLFIFAKHMGCSITDFFKGVGEDGPSVSVPDLSKEGRRIAEAYDAIQDPKIRDRVGKLVQAISQTDDTREAASHHVNGGAYRKVSQAEWEALGGDKNSLCDWHEGVGYVVYDAAARDQYAAKTSH